MLSQKNSRGKPQGTVSTPLRSAFLVATLLTLTNSFSAQAQFKSRYTNLPKVTGFGSAGQQPVMSNVGVQRPAPTGRPAKKAPVAQGPAGVYPQFRSNNGVIRWIPEQMPLKVWVSNGLTLDSILDPELGAPVANVDQVQKWPKLVADVLSNQGQIGTLQQANGFVPQHRQATIEGINYWKRFEKEGLFSFQFTEDPAEADIHVFYVNHFVNKQGLGLFANDIRGYTSKDCFWYREIVQGKQAPFKPVVILLCTTEKQGSVIMPPVKMRAAAGHEFGHALGIDGHSTNSNDLMSIYYGQGILSPSDVATIRHLYKLTPDLIP